eukprot:TRINITY_DN12268_c0_g2_i5.p1 TRINITY_DN12268_c0_g2~~TRINITY_DN12268_c0_g2_i5.p1  ORF type:complete len:109 (-),score=1.43 TRINITY_DN12268_c0_g2_i5:137-463(-)
MVLSHQLGAFPDAPAPAAGEAVKTVACGGKIGLVTRHQGRAQILHHRMLRSDDASHSIGKNADYISVPCQIDEIHQFASISLNFYLTSSYAKKPETQVKSQCFGITQM